MNECLYFIVQEAIVHTAIVKLRYYKLSCQGKNKTTNQSLVREARQAMTVFAEHDAEEINLHLALSNNS